MPEIVAYLNEAYWATGDAFGAAKDAGFRAVEIPEMFYEPPEDPAGERALRDRVEALGLGVIWHTHPKHNRHFGSEDRVLRQANIDRTARELDFAHRMGWTTFVIHPGKADSEAEKARAREALAGLAERAEGLGIQLALENASGPFDGDPGELAQTCREIPGVRLTYDCSHAYRSVYCREGRGDIVAHLTAVRPFVHSIQFNDYNGTANCALGRGVLPWDALMPMALEMACETWTIELHSVEETVASKAFLESWLADNPG